MKQTWWNWALNIKNPQSNVDSWALSLCHTIEMKWCVCRPVKWINPQESLMNLCFWRILNRLQLNVSDVLRAATVRSWSWDTILSVRVSCNSGCMLTICRNESEPRTSHAHDSKLLQLSRAVCAEQRAEWDVASLEAFAPFQRKTT